MENIKYDDNIELVRSVRGGIIGGKGVLADDEYYALMVMDTKRPGDERKFFNDAQGWLGLECTGMGKVYISKNVLDRQDERRGNVWVVKVADPTVCRDLGV